MFTYVFTYLTLLWQLQTSQGSNYVFTRFNSANIKFCVPACLIAYGAFNL
jgi:hypothetical protein